MGEPKTEAQGAIAGFRAATAAEAAELDDGVPSGDPEEKRRGSDVFREHREATSGDAGGSTRDELDDEENPTEEEEEPELPRARPASAGYPDWATFEQGVSFRPPRGAVVVFLRFPSEWTLAPDVGVQMPDLAARGDTRLYRWCATWSLSPGDEVTAAERCRGNPLRSVDEYTKASIRVVDGFKCDWSGRPSSGSVLQFWKELGPACRKEVKNVYVKTHSLDREKRIDFFVNCVVVATSAG